MDKLIFLHGSKKTDELLLHWPVQIKCLSDGYKTVQAECGIKVTLM